MTYDPDDFADPHDSRFFNRNQLLTLIEVGINMARYENNVDLTAEEIAADVVKIARVGSEYRSN